MKTLTERYSLQHLFAIAPLALAIGTAHAKEASDNVLEEIVVTAQKRVQSAQDIGVSVTSFGSEQIRDLGISAPKDVAAFTPGLSTTNATSGGTPIFAVRGIGLDDFNINNSSGVGAYFDEVFAGNPALLSGQVMDIERVEVLKGPQGTLYGKNTTGSAINYIAKKPTEETEASFTTGYSKWNTISTSGVLNGSLSESVNGRLAFSRVNQNDGWQTDINTGAEYGKEDKFAMRGMLSFDVSDTVDALLALRYAANESLPESPQGIDPFGAGAGGFSSLPSDSTAVDVGDLAVARDESGYGASLHVNADFDAVTLSSITAWDTYERMVVDNYNGFGSNVFDFFQDNEVDQWSQEFRLTSNSSDSFTWIAGLIYSVDEVLVRDISDSFIGGLVSADYVQTTDSLGLYFHTETELNERSTLTVGLRYSDDEREFVGDSTADFGFGSFQAAALDQTESESDLSYRIGIDYDLSDNALFYANVATGYKTGSFYGSPVSDQRVWGYTKPEEVFSYEFGLKLDLLDRAMRLNTAYFHYDYDDRQSLLVACQSDGGLCPVEGPDFSDLNDIFAAGLDNIAESEIDGFEAELQWLPVEGFDLRAGVGYLNSEITTPKSDLRGIPLLANIPAGAVLSQAPEWTYNAIAAYESDLSDTLYGRFQLAYSYKDEQVAALADPNAIYGPTKSVDARITLGSNEGEWQVALWGQNITDEDSLTYAFTNFLGGQTVYRQRPASYGVEFTVNFQ